jgi:hypothetical protein
VRRSTLVALAVLLLLGAYIYWFERDPVSEDEPSGELLFDVAEDDIVRIQVTPRDGEALVLARQEDGGFWLEEPVEAKAAESEIDRLLENLSTMRFARRVADLTEDEESRASAAYGLDEPVVEVRFRTSDERELGVRFGSDTPTGTNQYLSRVGDGEEEVLVASSYLSTPFEVTPWDVRDKYVFDSAGADDAWESGTVRLTVEQRDRDTDTDTGTGGRIVLERREGSWWLTEPLRARADRLQASDRLTSLRELEMQSLVSETSTAAELAGCGLASPRYRVVAELVERAEDTPPDLEIHVGDERELDVCARAPSRPQVFLIDSGFAENLSSAPAELVSRRLFHFVAGDVRRLRIESPFDGIVREAERAEEEEGEEDEDEDETEERWTVDDRGSSEPRDVAASVVNELLYELNGTSADDVEAAPTVSAESAKWRLTVELDDGTRESVALILPENNGEQDPVYALRESESLALVLSAGAWTEIEALLELTPADDDSP